MPSAESRWDVEVKEDQDLLLHPLYASAGLTFSCRIVTGARCTFYSKWLDSKHIFLVVNIQDLFCLWKACMVELLAS